MLTTTPTTPTTAATPSLLLYFAADQVVALGNALTATTIVPGKEVRVKTVDLATLAFAAAFWSLREQGLIALTILEKKRLLVFSDTRVGIALRHEATRPGLEGGILRQLESTRDPHVRTVIYDWFGQDVATPHSDVISALNREAVARGYMDEVDAHRNAVTGLLKGKVELVPNTEKIAALAQDCQQAVARWTSFQQNDSALATALLKQCKSGIGNRAETDHDGVDLPDFGS